MENKLRLSRWIQLFIAVAVVMLVASPAIAKRWGGGNTLSSGSGAQGGTRTYDWTTDTTASDALITDCGKIQYVYDDDILGSDTTAAATLLSCADINTPAAQCTSTALTVDASGTLTSDEPVLYVNSITATAGTTAKARVAIRCQEAFASSGGAGHTIQDESVDLTARTNLNFTGAGVTCTDDSGNDQTDCTISGSATGTGFTLLTDLCTTVGNTPEDADCGGPDGTIDGEDLQRQIYLSCTVDNTTTGEACGTIVLPEGVIEVATTITIGDKDSTASNYGITGSLLDAADTPDNPFDGRLHGLRIIGQGKGDIYGTTASAGTTLKWTGAAGGTVLQVNALNHGVLSDFSIWGAGTADKCIQISPNEVYGSRMDGLYMRIDCMDVDAIGIDFYDGDTIDDIFTLSSSCTDVFNDAGTPQTTGSAGDGLCDVDRAAKQVNGKSEHMFADVFVRDAPVGVRWSINNTQGSVLTGRVQNFGLNAATPSITAADLESCGGGSAETGGSVGGGCAVDHRDGDLEIRDMVMASPVADTDPSADSAYHSSTAVDTIILRNVYTEMDEGLAHITSRGGAESGGIKSLTLENVSLFDFASSGIRHAIDWGAAGTINIDGLYIANSQGGDMSIDIDSLASTGSNTLNVRGVFFNLTGGDPIVEIDRDSEGNIDGNFSYRTLCTDASADDGICDGTASCTDTADDSGGVATPQSGGSADGYCDANYARLNEIADGVERHMVLGWTEYGTGDPADAGVIRLEDAASICTENNPTGTDACIAGNAGIWEIDGDPIIVDQSIDTASEFSAIMTEVDGTGDFARVGNTTFTGTTTVTDLVATTVTLAASATPTQTFLDSNTDEVDSSIKITTNCTDAGVGTEDCDYWLDTLVSGAGTTGTSPDDVNSNTRLFIDADGPTYVGNNYVYIGDSASPATPDTAAGDGDLFVEDALEVNGATDLDGTLNVAGAVTLQGALTVSGALVAPMAGATSTGGALAINTVTIATAGPADYDIPDSCDSATFNWVMLYVRDVSEVASLTVAASEDTIVYKGLSLDADDELDSPGAAQDSVVAVCMETNLWYVTANSGDWVDGGAAD